MIALNTSKFNIIENIPLYSILLHKIMIIFIEKHHIKARRTSGNTFFKPGGSRTNQTSYDIGNISLHKPSNILQIQLQDTK